MGIIDIANQRFGKLVVDSFAYTKNNRAYWDCTCDCGNHCIKMGKYLRNGETKSCGCYNKERIKKIGLSNIKRNKYEVLEDGKTVKVFFHNTDNYFLCDLEDWIPIADTYTWWESEHGYARTNLGKDNKFMFFHSYVLNEFPSENRICDHINRNRLDNRKENLRMITRAENAYNQNKYKNNKTGHTGVYNYSSTDKWVAYINYNKQRVNCGVFSSYEDAVKAREEKELELYGFIKEKGINAQKGCD